MSADVRQLTLVGPIGLFMMGVGFDVWIQEAEGVWYFDYYPRIY